MQLLLGVLKGMETQDICLMQVLQEREEDIQQQLMVYLIDLENHVKHPFPKLLWVSY